MPPVLRALPYFEEETVIIGRGVHETARSHQIIVWVSVTTVEQFDPPTDRRFPAILDTGHNDNFAISPLQLRMWARLHWHELPEEGVSRFYDAGPVIGSVAVPMRRAVVWLHPNQHGWRDHFDPLRPAVPIELSYGIAVYGKELVGEDPNTPKLKGPRLPLLGLRALTGMGCDLRIDSRNRLVWLESPD